MTTCQIAIVCLALGGGSSPGDSPAAPTGGKEWTWASPNGYRLILRVDCRGRGRSNSPASVDVDFAPMLRQERIMGTIDENTIEVVGYDDSGAAKVFDASRNGYRRHLLPWRVEKHYPLAKVTLHFVIPDETCTTCAVYFNTAESESKATPCYGGLVGDGDRFREEYGKRAIGATHFDTFCDLDGDGDLDLFQGGVEPFIHCWENVGNHRLVDRGRLTSGGQLLTLPKSDVGNRSWVVPHFHDWDGDGDQDFLPSFMDGPYARKIALFENVTSAGSLLAFVDRGPLKTVSGTPLGGGSHDRYWFPSVVFVKDFDGDRDERTDLLVGINDRCYSHRNLGPDGRGGWRLADAVPLEAGGEPIVLFNPCFEVADVDSDGDWDLFGAPQSGQIYWFENVDATPSRTEPTFAQGVVVAYDQRYLQRSTHPRVKVADFTGDGLPDLVIDRAWELADLDRVSHQRDYGGLWKNVGTATHPKWERVGPGQGGPYTEGFPICDALRQNVVRAVDWNNDGRPDLLAGDCDGFVWHFQNRGNHLRPLFAPGRRLSAGGILLSVADRQGHARPDVCDWNNDGRKDLIVADGAGTVTVYLNQGSDADPKLAPGREVEAYDADGVLKPIARGTRSHVIVCDWNRDGKKDLVFSDQDNPGFYFFENVATNGAPRFGPAERIGLRPYVRPNLGACVDWDGDGRMDFIGCEFEHSIRFYRNVGSGEPGAVPELADPDGLAIVRPDTIMMISGADAVDWNRDGDVDILTGQGHGASGIRFYERDYIEDCLRGTHPVVKVEGLERAGSTSPDHDDGGPSRRGFR
ncbi:MAG: FG-GAP repeat domain-containing protein [Planctomycetota bacterium]|jgi:hypothetical protein